MGTLTNCCAWPLFVFSHDIGFGTEPKDLFCLVLLTQRRYDNDYRQTVTQWEQHAWMEEIRVTACPFWSTDCIEDTIKVEDTTLCPNHSFFNSFCPTHYTLRSNYLARHQHLRPAFTREQQQQQHHQLARVGSQQYPRPQHTRAYLEPRICRLDPYLYHPAPLHQQVRRPLFIRTHEVVL